MELIDYLEKNFSKNTPIFINDINISDMPYDNIRQILSRLVRAQKVARFSQGVYYLPTKTYLGNSLLSPDLVIERKYLKSNNEVYGYYTGLSFENTIGVTTQLPNIRRIVTNNESSRKRKINIGYQTIILEKPYCKITNENYLLMQFLDFINNNPLYVIRDSKDILIKYIKKNNFKRYQVEELIVYFPAKLAKKLVESRLLYEFA
ncbi:MAG: DUF6088 family protein [Bacilli bacterium]|nr:DUF6088 family protein [Bacilli bacterium]